MTLETIAIIELALAGVAMFTGVGHYDWFKVTLCLCGLSMSAALIAITQAIRARRQDG